VTGSYVPGQSAVFTDLSSYSLIMVTFVSP
jgi:hypothetical protein